MASRPIKALAADCVIFDLDGTLVDTAPDLLATLNVLLTEMGRRPLELDEIKEAVGYGAKALIRNGGKITGDPFDEETVEALFGRYLAHYGANIANESEPFPGAIEVLDALKERGVPMAICTNKLEDLTHKLLEALKILSYFEVIVGLDTLEKAKPDPLPVREILRRVGAKPERTLFVGDSETDLKAARAAGVPVVLADFGYSPVPVRQLAADAVIGNLREIL